MTQVEKTYKTIKDQISYEFEIEKSIFISSCKYVESEKEALDFIEEIKKTHNQANHNCHAYIINDSQVIKRYSDDGEPQGSAGLPMLSVLEKEDVKNIVSVVTRYFGGKKLGKAGLVRAYTKAVASCIDQKIVYKSPFYEVKLTHAYKILGQIENFLAERKIKIIGKEYLEQVIISLYIREEDFEEFEKRLIDMTSAKINIEIIGKTMLFHN